jgi:hypothetical protein
MYILWRAHVAKTRVRRRREALGKSGMARKDGGIEKLDESGVEWEEGEWV